MKNYNDFLGIKEIKNDKILTVVSSPNRDILYAKRFYYPIIATNINNSIVISCSSKIADKLNKKINEIKELSENNLKDFLNQFAENEFKTFEIKEMYRLIKQSNEKCVNCDDVELIDESKKQYFYNIVKKSNEIKYKKQKWNEFNKIKAQWRN